MVRLLSPLGFMVLLVLLGGAADILSAYHGVYASAKADLLWKLGFGFSVMWWVYRDRGRRRYHTIFDFEAFAFFGWPIVLPYYLFKTRRWRAVPIVVSWAFALILPEALSVYLLVRG